jgi:hypothetical protein
MPGHEADHSPVPSVKVKNVHSYTSTLPFIFINYAKEYTFVAWCSIKHRDNLDSLPFMTASEEDKNQVSYLNFTT